MVGPPEDSGDIYCPSCGERMQQTANFCRNCGEPNPRAGSDGQTEAVGNTDPQRENRDPAGDDPWETDQTTQVEESVDVTGPRKAGAAHGEMGAGPGHADLPQWRAYLPRQVRPDEESRLWAVVVAVGLAAAAILAPIVVSIGLALVGGVFVGILAPSLLTDPPFVAVAAVVIVLVLAQFAWFVVFGLWYLRRRGFSREQIVSYLGIERPTARQVGLIIGTAVAMVVAAGVLSSVLLEVVELLGFDVEPAENQSTQILEDNPNPALLVGGILLMFLVVGPAEELLFRGVIQGRLRERLPAWSAIAIASVVFGSIHLFALGGGGGAAGMATTIAVLSTVAVALGGVYEYTGNVVVAALTHGLYNSILVTGLYVTAASDVGSEEQMTAVEAVVALL
jgi:membrane protease YdiL (CAAX protease family)